ncbi:MAG: cytochrome c3 family protein [Methylocystis sp.]|uniref:cytochrome c3 family protein n=1 Tax=Methylocystis sp. TaxID=1911079 RepID=UPI003DA491E5
MGAAFQPAANLWAAIALALGGGVIAAAIVFGWLWQTSDFARGVRSAQAQPVPFSHQHHVSGLGIDCRYCHDTVERAATAGMPPTYTCMTCHSQIWTNARILEPVRQSLAQNKPIVWRRVTDLPDYAYFNHSIHIAKGVGCFSCHGDVAAMPLTWKARTLTMGFCLDCHRDPGPNLRPRDKIFDTTARPRPDPASARTLLAFYHIGSRDLTDCSICHR